MSAWNWSERQGPRCYIANFLKWIRYGSTIVAKKGIIQASVKFKYSFFLGNGVAWLELKTQWNWILMVEQRSWAIFNSSTQGKVTSIAYHQIKQTWVSFSTSLKTTSTSIASSSISQLMSHGRCLIRKVNWLRYLWIYAIANTTSGFLYDVHYRYFTYCSWWKWLSSGQPQTLKKSCLRHPRWQDISYSQ